MDIYKYFSPYRSSKPPVHMRTRIPIKIDPTYEGCDVDQIMPSFDIKYIELIAIKFYVNKQTVWFNIVHGAMPPILWDSFNTPNIVPLGHPNEFSQTYAKSFEV